MDDDNPSVGSGGEIEVLWLAEAERRLEELRSGQVQGIDAGEVFERAREALKN